MADVLDITDAPSITLRDAKRGKGEPYGRTLDFKGGEPNHRRPLLWPCDTGLPLVQALHDASALPDLSSDVHTYFVRDVTSGGFGSQLHRDGHYLVARDFYPGYVGEFIRSEISRPYWEVEPRPRTRKIETAFLISHMNPMYGHWLLEILPKLFAIKDLTKRGVNAPILIPSHVFPFVKANISHVVLWHRVIEYDRTRENVQVRRAIMPAMMQQSYIFNGAFHTALNAFLTPLRAKPGPEAIFVSRSGLRESFRQLENVDALDQTAARLGLTVIRPEELPWIEQVRLFASAKLVVGEYGSGMHNTIFSPPGTKVVCLNVVNELQSLIANAFGHDLGFILDPDGKPRLFGLEWQDQQGYRVDLNAFEDRIAPLMAQITGPASRHP